MSESLTPAEVKQALIAIGIPEDAISDLGLPGTLIGAAAGQIWGLGGDLGRAIELLDKIADVDCSDPYWLQSTTPDTPGNEALLIDQAVRILRVGYNEIWEIVLDFDENYNATAPDDDPVAVARVEASRMTAMEATRLLVKLAFQAMPDTERGH